MSRQCRRIVPSPFSFHCLTQRETSKINQLKLARQIIKLLGHTFSSRSQIQHVSWAMSLEVLSSSGQDVFIRYHMLRNDMISSLY